MAWRSSAPPITPTSTVCMECREPLDPMPGGSSFCEACQAAIAACTEGSQERAQTRWLAVLERVPGESAATFAFIRPVLERPDGTLVLTARRTIRRWIKHRYSEWLPAVAGTPVEILPPQAAAAELEESR